MLPGAEQSFDSNKSSQLLESRRVKEFKLRMRKQYEAMFASEIDQLDKAYSV